MAGIDVSRFKTSDWLKMGGALGFLIFGFFEWVTVEFESNGFSFSDGGGNVFDFFWTGILPWLLILGTGVLTFLLVQGIVKGGKAPWPLIFLLATGLGALLLLIRLLFNPLDGKDAVEDAGGDVGRGIGLWLSAISGVVAFVGALLGFKESGGELSDLTDMDKLKRSFNTGAPSSSTRTTTTPPPPPPATGTNPPPPPPPA